MALLFAPILFIAVIIFVAYPFLTESEEAAVREKEESALERARKRKEDIIEVLKDIEMDYQMGKLSDEDYSSLKTEQELMAVEVFKELDALEAKPPANRKKS